MVISGAGRWWSDSMDCRLQKLDQIKQSGFHIMAGSKNRLI